MPRRADSSSAKNRQDRIAAFQAKIETQREEKSRIKPRAERQQAEGQAEPAAAAFKVGDKVVRRRGVDECLDAPGEIGEVVDAQDHKEHDLKDGVKIVAAHYEVDPTGRSKPQRAPYQVRAFDGKVKWYSETELMVYEGATPSKVILMQAAQRGDLELIGKCVFSGTDINTQDASGATAMHYAARGGQAEALSVLIANKANIDVLNAKLQTPLFVASST